MLPGVSLPLRAARPSGRQTTSASPSEAPDNFVNFPETANFPDDCYKLVSLYNYNDEDIIDIMRTLSFHRFR